MGYAPAMGWRMDMARRRGSAVLAASGLLLAGCFGGDPPGATAAPPGTASATPRPAAHEWRSVATVTDRDRLRRWRVAWTEALAKAIGAGHGRQISVEGALLRPDAALADPAPPPGDYRCRVIKIGAQAPQLPDYVAYPAFACRISAQPGLPGFAKLTGSQRPVGVLYPDDQPRRIFLGTLMLGDERSALPYGRDRERDLAGMLERVGPQRWRLVFPYPHWESMLDVIELVPAG